MTALLFTRLVILFIACFVSTSAYCTPKESGKKGTVQWAIQKTSTLRIAGKTNVAAFGCDINGYYQADTIAYLNDGNPGPVSLTGALNIDVNNFDCHHKMLTNDLRKTLKAKEYPFLIIRFLTLQRLPALTDNRDVLNGTVEIQLAGVCRRFEICYKLEKSGAVILLNGSRTFLFSDFSHICKPRIIQRDSNRTGYGRFQRIKQHHQTFLF